MEYFVKVRDLKIHLAFPLHVRRIIGEDRFEQLVREDLEGKADIALDAVERGANAPEDQIVLPAGNHLMMWQLIRDGYIAMVPERTVYVDGHPIMEGFRLTDSGKEFLDQWITADGLNPEQFKNCECDVGTTFAHHLRHHVRADGFDVEARAMRAG